MLSMVEFSDSKKIGIFFLLLGVLFLALGTLLLFDRKLLAMGNLMFLVGFAIISGPLASLKFFGLYGEGMRERWAKRWRGLLTFLGGILLVLFGYTMIGMFCEIFGFLNLFGSLFPVALAFLRKLPVVGPCLDLPMVAQLADAVAGKTKTTESMV